MRLPVIKDRAPLGTVLIAAILAINGCGASEGPQTAALTTNPGASLGAQSVTSSTTALAPSSAATTSPASSTLPLPTGYPPLIIDRSGPYSGELLLGPSKTDAIVLSVNADSEWTAEIVPLAEHPPAELATTGQGDAVVVITDPATSVTLAHESEGGFSVKIFDADGTSLTIMETGQSSDTYSFQTPGIITVIADGTWTITASAGA